MLIDSHCHLNRLDLTQYNGDLSAVMAAARDNDVGHILSAGVTLEEIPEIIAIAESYSNVTCTIGVHPSEEECREPTVDELIKLSSHKKVVGLGETGLDYYWPGDREKQKKRFRIHLEAAKEIKKPLIIHARDCFDDIFPMIKEMKIDEVGGVFHCFTGDVEIAKKIMDFGFYIGISGIVTFKKATQVHEVAKNMPLDRMLLETDAPYLAPTPFRGKPNEPAFLKLTAEYVAWLRDVPLEEIAKATTNNFYQLFKGIVIPRLDRGIQY
jgi:TatD DNase family protein